MPGEAANGAQVLEAVRTGGFDVLVLDITIPGRSGLDLIKLVKAQRPEMRVLVLSMDSEKQYAVRAVRAGASGYLTKETASEELATAIRRIASGGAYVTPETAERLVLQSSTPRGRRSAFKLSDREYEVFRMIITGKSLTEIAELLNLSVKTISTHKTRILEKMKLASTADLVRYAGDHGLPEDRGGRLNAQWPIYPRHVGARLLCLSRMLTACARSPDVRTGTRRRGSSPATRCSCRPTTHARSNCCNTTGLARRHTRIPRVRTCSCVPDPPPVLPQ
jgi:DNA-binding NarL/FixJ family response regulator